MDLSFSVDHHMCFCCCWRKWVPMSAYMEAEFIQTSDRPVLIAVLIESQPLELLPLSHKIKPLWPFFLGPQNKTAMSMLVVTLWG